MIIKPMRMVKERVKRGEVCLKGFLLFITEEAVNSPFLTYLRADMGRKPGMSRVMRREVCMLVGQQNKIVTKSLKTLINAPIASLPAGAHFHCFLCARALEMLWHKFPVEIWPHLAVGECPIRRNSFFDESVTANCLCLLRST